MDSLRSNETQFKIRHKFVTLGPRFILAQLSLVELCHTHFLIPYKAHFGSATGVADATQSCYSVPLLNFF